MEKDPNQVRETESKGNFNETDTNHKRRFRVHPMDAKFR